MTFLAFSAAQAWMVLGGTTLAVLILFFLKLRHPRVVVGSLVLWQRVFEDKQHRSLIERLRRLISLLLVLLIAWLIAAALGRPQSDVITGQVRRTAVVVDTTLSMAARAAADETRWSNARRAVERIVATASPIDEFQIVAASGRVVTPMTADRAVVAAALERLTPTAVQPRALRLDPRRDRTVAITDGVTPLALPDGTEILSVFEPADNVGITAFEIRPRLEDESAYEAAVEIASFTRAARDVEVRIEAAGQPHATETVSLAAGEVTQRVFSLAGLADSEIRAVLRVTGDALTLDDVAYGYVPPETQVRVTLVTDGNDFLETLFGLDPRVQLVVVAPAAFETAMIADVYVFDRFAPADPPSRPALLLRPPPTAWLSEIVSFDNREALDPPVTVWNATHPVLRSVPPTDLRIERARNLEPVGGASVTVAAASGTLPLVLAHDGAPRWVLVSFALDDSDFALRPGFPIFVQNVLGWFVGEPRALQRRVGTVSVPLDHATITVGGGREIQAQPFLGETRFDALEPGLYVATTPAAQQRVAVNLASRRESDLNRTAGTVPATPDTATGWPTPELWVWMLAAATILIALEWWTYHRRITV